MNSKVKTALKAVAALLVILMPLALIFGIVVLTVPQYSNTFVGVLDDKVDRLKSIEEEKLIVVGGSSVAFGLDSELLEEYVGMPVVNFGLYAALGTKVMLDLSRAGISRGDVVIIAPEVSAQTMSMYFNTETTLQAIDDDYSLLRYMDINNIPSLLSGMFRHVGNKVKLAVSGKPDPEGVYNSKSFNEYGDVVYERPSNVMELYYDPNTPIVLDESIINEPFIDYLNEYIAYCRLVGAEVYFSFSPMNELAVKEQYTSEELRAFEKLLGEKIDCDIISYADDYILDAGYFFDSNFHLNDTGVKYRTLRLAEDIILAEEIPTLVLEPYPEVPALRDGLIMLEGEEPDVNEKYFTYEALPNGNYMITGLTELGKTQTSLTLPIGVRLGDSNNLVAVTTLGEGAFSGGIAQRVTVSADSRLKQLMNGAFTGAGSLTRLDLYIESAESVLPPADFIGTASSFEIHVSSSSSYRSDYFWSSFADIIKSDL
ncbi:MAG: hypothetical protein IJY01_07285 [Clostridia bacterium]|nr:hypothetical protein [Clostridia bacterium]